MSGKRCRKTSVPLVNSQCGSMQNWASHIRTEHVKDQVDLDEYLNQVVAELEQATSRLPNRLQDMGRKELTLARVQLGFDRERLAETAKPGGVWHEWIQGDELDAEHQVGGLALVR